MTVLTLKMIFMKVFVELRHVGVAELVATISVVPHSRVLFPTMGDEVRKM